VAGSLKRKIGIQEAGRIFGIKRVRSNPMLLQFLKPVEFKEKYGLKE
jgi:hypothetical protein